MQFPRPHQRVERRRRALAEELASSDEGALAARSATPPRSRRAEVYAPGAKPEHQRRVIDLVPHSYLVIGLWFLAGLTTIAGLAAGHVWQGELAERISAAGSAPLELGSRGSLASWFASVTLGMCSLVSLLIYAIRRHKLDDYRGRYRWWLVAAVTWMAMSIDATAGVHQLISSAIVRLGGQVGPLNETTLWLAGCGLILAAMSIRLLWDMRRCRAASLIYLIAIAAWGAGIAIELTGIRVGTFGSALPAEVGKLLGHLLLLLGLGLYARHVILHAQGMLPGGKQAKAKAKRDAKAAAGAAANVAKIDAAHSTSGQPRTDLQPHIPTAPAKHGAAKPDSDDDDSAYDDDEDDDYNSGRTIDKAERKRLRRLKAEQRGR